MPDGFITPSVSIAERRITFMEQEIILIIKPPNANGIAMKPTGKRIHALCKRKGLSVRQIQEGLCISSFQSIYAWFAGKTLPNLENMYQLSRLLDTSMEEIIANEPDSLCLELSTKNVKEKLFSKKIKQYLLYLQ